MSEVVLVCISSRVYVGMCSVLWLVLPGRRECFCRSVSNTEEWKWARRDGRGQQGRVRGPGSAPRERIPREWKVGGRKGSGRQAVVKLRVGVERLEWRTGSIMKIVYHPLRSCDHYGVPGRKHSARGTLGLQQEPNFLF